MEEPIFLYDSTICRLCGEANENGILLFPDEEPEPELCNTINRYLPLKVQNDGKFPRSICPGCNIQLDAMVEFMELIISGQQKIRELWRTEQDILRRKEKESAAFEENFKFNSDPNIAAPFTIQALEENGKEIVIQIMPDGSLYAPDHEMSLKVEGLEKPKRKRGRPPKPPPGTVKSEDATKPDQEYKEEEEELEEDGDDGRRRRRRKVPSRFREAVQGKELERIFREEGVIDEEDETEEDGSDERHVPVLDGIGDEIIGHLENKDGTDLGELVIVNKVKRLKNRGRKKKNYTCEICDRGFMHYGRYLLHKTFHKGIKYECSTCTHLFITKEELMEHQLSTQHTGEGIVETLDEQIVDEDDVKENSIKSVEPISPEHKFQCEQCEKSFMSKQSYEVHIKAIHEGQKPFQCEKCDKTFAYQASLRGHMVSHEQKTDKGYPCDLCEKIFNHPSSVVYHKEAEHNNGRRFVCNKCGKNFKHKQLLQRHQLVHTDQRPFTCKICGASFKTRANLLNHQPTHTGIKKFFCQQCGQLFAHKTSLTLHYRWHNGQKPYECNVCKKSFSQKGNLEEHRRIHTGEKPYSCEFCGRKFTTSSQFKLHVKRHTGERPWSCEFCNKTFLHKDTWKCHMRRHRNEKPFQCQICLRAFTEQWALKKHFRLHTGEKPYVCDVCNKAFADCSNLTKHKKVHRNFIKDDLEKVASVAPEATTEGEGSVIYVTYQDNQNSALVQILDDSENHLADTDGMIEEPPEQSDQLELEQFDENALPLPGGQLQVTDEQGNPIYFTTQTGQQIRVTSFDGDNLQVCLDDGSILPIQVNAENGKAVAVEITETDDELKVKEQLLDDSVTQLSNEKSSDHDVSNLMEQSVQFMTEDGQNVCLVTSYNMDSDNMNTTYLPIT